MKFLKFLLPIILGLMLFIGGFIAVKHSLSIYAMASYILEEKKNLNVKHINEDIPLDPEWNLWDSVEGEQIHLIPQIARAPFGFEERDILVKAVYNSEEIAFLLEFKDETESRQPPANPDACAILFVPANGPATKQVMGFGSIANVWQWLADRDFQKYSQNIDINPVREPIARRPGTQTPMKFQFVEGKGIYKDGKWKVIFKRKLKKQQEDEFDFKEGFPMEVAFAIWDGHKMEGSSKKSIAILRKLIMGER